MNIFEKINVLMFTDLRVGDIIHSLCLQEIHEHDQSSKFKSEIP